jgi:hypothetical protein
VPTGIRDSQGFVIEPTFWLFGILIKDFIGLILIPVIRLLSIRIRDAFDIDPVLGLLILGVVNLFRRIDRRSEILEKVTAIDAFTVELDVISIIGAGGISGRECEYVTERLTVQRVCKD